MHPPNAREYERLAAERLTPGVLAFYAGGALDEVTLAENEAAFLRRRLRPRVLVDVSAVDTSTTLLGTPVAMPIGIAPTAQHAYAHRDAEGATADACAASGALLCASMMSSRTLEEMAKPGGARWFQVYVLRDRELTRSLVERAAAAGYTALVLTVDTPVPGPRERDLAPDFRIDPPLLANLTSAPGVAHIVEIARGLFDPALSWRDIDWLRSIAPLPLVLKGIMTAEDARLAVDHGAQGVWVSNHGGRQLDRVPATIDVLEEVVDAVHGGAEIYLDGGVRRGVDAAIALALGARAVFIGRPALYALAVDGGAGVAHLLAMLRAELASAMALLGTASIDELQRGHVI